MKLDDWLKGERGRLADLARHFGLTQSAVSQWRVDGVPLHRMRGVMSFTKGEVALDDMVPPAVEDQLSNEVAQHVAHGLVSSCRVIGLDGHTREGMQ